MTEHRETEVFDQEDLTYDGNITVERSRRQGGVIVWRDWLMFDSVEEAMEFYCQYAAA